jgi:hypothetical protein
MEGNIILNQIEQIGVGLALIIFHLCLSLPLPPTLACYTRVCLARKSSYKEPTKINLFILGMCW